MAVIKNVQFFISVFFAVFFTVSAVINAMDGEIALCAVSAAFAVINVVAFLAGADDDEEPIR